ncbi:AEL_HP2_G0025660.mRNA.1.CDS.1 [Saccharomyces cerevisiae]|nr:AEL_HP2_G0025660.mRNA.1.CDS.1 [Saccharomyces cerevisiae]CAI6459680.1 AEL_HP2_G0025660.mRNA.1.CDS.1 [Saccharomyces cerevisiae]
MFPKKSSSNSYVMSNKSTSDPAIEMQDVKNKDLLHVKSNSLEVDYEGTVDQLQDVESVGGSTHGLKKDLKARHVSMIAIGGALGTGLLIGTGTSLSTAGPASVVIAYSFIGVLVFFTMTCLGEMSAYITLDGFTSYASRYCDKALGFAVGYTYLFKYLIMCPNQLTAAALVIQYWISRERVNPGVWITIFLVIISFVNFIGVKYFGELEFWLSSFKVLVMIGLMLFLFIIMLGGGPGHDRLGFRYWKDPGAFKPYSAKIDGSTGKFVSFVAVIVYALFAYLGTELTGIIAAEAENPRKSVPPAMKLTMYRIIIFYIVNVFLLSMCVPYNDPLLLSAKTKSTSAAASPFVVAMVNANVKILPHVFNACVLLFVLSAANSDLYVASRSLYGLAADGKAPGIFKRTNRWGIPYYSLSVAVLFGLLSYMNVSSGSAQIFNYFVNVTSILGLLSWICILITYICFDRALKAQGIAKSSLAYSAPLQPYGAYFALFFCCLIALIKNFTVFLDVKNFDYKTFITGYIGLPVFAALFFGYKIVYKTKFVRPEEADLYTNKDIIDMEEEYYNFLEKEKRQRLKENGKNMEWFYEKFIGKIF